MSADGVSGKGLRVLVTVDAVGGVWQYGLDLARGLAARGVIPVIAVLGPACTAAQRAEAGAITGATLVETGLPLDWLCDHAAPVLAAGAAIATLAQDLAADLVHLNSPVLGAAMPADLPMVAVAHGCVSTWWQTAQPDEVMGPAFAWHRDLMARGLAAADRIVAPTASYAESVARAYALPCAPQVVHNGRTPLPARPTHGLADRALTAGRLWDRVKRTELLDRVAGTLATPFDAAGAVTAPHGEHVDLRHLNPLGQLDTAALAARMAARPVFVSAASFEPFGLAVLEAAQASCALVLSDIAGFHELWDGAALFVASDDETVWADAIAALIADHPRRERMGEAARIHAARYTPQATADMMLAIYGDVLDRRETRARAAA